MGNIRAIVIGFCGWAAVMGGGSGAHAEGTPALRHVGAVPLPGVSGRIDHLAIDVDNQRLFVAALGNGSVEVIDLRAGTRSRSVKGLKEPQGLIYLPSLRKAVVASGGGSVVSFDDGAPPKTDTLAALADADNVRFDSGAGRLYVGYGGGALAVFDQAHMRRLGDIKLPGHPEAFALHSSTAALYVNVPATKSIVVVDRLKGRVVSTITLKSVEGNYPMALDEAGDRLFVGTRKPARVVILEARNTQVIGSFPCVADADDLFYDGVRDRVYVTGGAGFVDVFDASEAGKHLRLAHVATAPGARTSLWVPELRRLFVAVPRQGSADASIEIFEAPELP